MQVIQNQFFYEHKGQENKYLDAWMVLLKAIVINHFIYITYDLLASQGFG